MNIECCAKKKLEVLHSLSALGIWLLQLIKNGTVCDCVCVYMPKVSVNSKQLPQFYVVLKHLYYIYTPNKIS